MAEFVPFSAWRRFLALPNESRGKTIGMALAVSAVCALLVTTATVVLRPIQAQNRAAEQQARLEALVARVPGMTEFLAASPDAKLSTVVIDLARGAAAKEVTPETLQTAIADQSNWTALPPAQDIAGLGSRPNYAQIYLLREGDAIKLAILPISGAGFNGPLQAMLALEGDMRTVAGMVVTQQSETPGLGARIEEPAWQSSFAGKQVTDEDGTVHFTVAKGAARSDYEVDGITGATRTSNAMTQMIRFWVGPEGYGPLMAAIRRGEF